MQCESQARARQLRRGTSVAGRGYPVCAELHSTPDAAKRLWEQRLRAEVRPSPTPFCLRRSGTLTELVETLTPRDAMDIIARR
jgi:hypothetical protein